LIRKEECKKTQGKKLKFPFTLPLSPTGRGRGRGGKKGVR
jgi:hypothetical protein